MISWKLGVFFWHNRWWGLAYRLVRLESLFSVYRKLSRKISFVHNSIMNGTFFLLFSARHGSDTAMLCSKFQIDWEAEADVTDERYFAIFEIEMGCRAVSYIAITPLEFVILTNKLEYDQHIEAETKCFFLNGKFEFGLKFYWRLFPCV